MQKHAIFAACTALSASLALLCYSQETICTDAERAELLARSDSLFAAGVDLYNAGKYSEALQPFAESDSIDKAVLDSTSNRRDYSAMWLASCYYKLNDTTAAAQLDPKYYMAQPVDRRLTVESDSLYALGVEAYSDKDMAGAIKYIQESADILKQQVGDCPSYASTLEDLAGCYSSSSNYAEAIRLATEALDIRERILGKHTKDYMNTLDNLANYHYFSRNYSEATRLGSEALSVCESLYGKKNSDYAVLLNNLSLYNYAGANYDEAIRLGTEALDIKSEIIGRNTKSYANSLYNLASYYSAAGNYSKAISLVSEALEIQEEILGKENDDNANTLATLANSNAYLGNYSEAIRCATESLEITERLHGRNYRDCAILLNNLANYNSNIDNYREAIRLTKEALKIYEATSGREDSAFATALANLATYYYDLGDYSETLRIATEALNIREKVLGKNHQDYALSLSDLATCNRTLGNYKVAIRQNTEARTIIKQVLGEKHPYYSASLNNLSALYGSMGNYSEAIRLCTQALNMRSATLGKNHPDYAASLSNLAALYGLIGNYAEALQFDTEALQIRKNNFGNAHSMVALSLNNLAADYYSLRNYAEALRLCTEALNIREKVLGKNHQDYALSLGNVALCNSHLGNYDEAIGEITEALNIYEKSIGPNSRAYANALNSLAGFNFSIGNYSEAANLAYEALQIRERILGTEHPDYAKALGLLSDYDFSLGNVDDGVNYELEYYTRSKEVVCRTFSDLTTAERTLYWPQYKEIFLNRLPLRAYSYSSQDLVTTAYSGLLFGKGLLLNAETELRKIILENGNQEAIEVIDSLKINRRMLNKQLEKPISARTLSTDSLSNLVNGLEHKLIAISREYGDYTKNLRIDVKDVQAKLTNDDIAVEFASFDVNDTTIYCAYLLKSDYDSPKMKVCLKQTNRNMFSNAYYGTELSEAIWGTLAPELEGVKNVYFAPSGELYNVAIESLPDWENPSAPISNRWNFYRLSSTRELALIKDKNKIKQSVVYGGLKYDTDTATIARNSRQYGALDAFAVRSIAANSLDLRDGVADLPGTKLEANVIDRKLRAVKIDDIVRTDTTGTEASFKALSGQKKNLLHIATHGFYWTETEARKVENLSFLLGNDEKSYQEDKALTRSGLLFAGANNALKGQPLPDGVDDGILTAQEISQLDLRGLDLVVLSACETGLGEISGDGVFGLQRGFKKAGAQSIMMSLWKVNDTATQMLMTQFYTNLTRGLSKRQSLLDAQRYLREYEVEETVSTNGNLTESQKRRNERQNISTETTTETQKVHPYANPKYWAAFILLDALD